MSVLYHKIVDAYTKFAQNCLNEVYKFLLEHFLTRCIFYVFKKKHY